LLLQLVTVQLDSIMSQLKLVNTVLLNVPNVLTDVPLVNLIPITV